MLTDGAQYAGKRIAWAATAAGRMLG